MSKKVVIAFGRLNPITNGHEKLANKIKSVAKSNSAVAKLYLSHSTNPKKDPLEYQTKIKFAKKAFGNIVTASSAKTIFEALQELDGKFDEVIVVAGSDRVSEFDTMIKKYNGNLYNFKTLEAVSAGERDPDAEGVEGMSASKMRGFAAKNDFESFKKGVPSKLSETDAKKLFDEVRKGMKINENTESNLEKISEALEENLDEIFAAEMLPDLKEVLSLAGRRKRAMQIRRLKAKIQRSRMLALKRFANARKLGVRSRRLATKFLKRRLSGGKAYASMSAGQKQMIDKKIEKLRPAVTKIASRLLPRVRRTELERKRGMSQQKESFDLNDSFINLFEGPKLPQDKDVASREGTQPKKYYAGLDKGTKQSRDAHFKAHAKKSDSDPSSYKDAPGDKEAREKGMPESKHTKKFKQMYGEQLDKKQVGRLEQLVRLGLADKTMLATIKRSIDKIGKGDTLTPPERSATQSLLNTLLDMVTSADSLFRLTKTQVQKEDFELLDETLKQVTDKEGNKKWALVSKTTGRVLQYYDGEGKPSADWVAKVERRVHAFENFILESESEEEDDQESDGLYMARVQLSNLIDDTEEILTMMESMEEEPEEWILSKITLAADYMSTARDYLEYYSDEEMEDDEEEDEEEDEDEGYEFPEYEMYECIADMSPEDFGDLKEEFMDLFEEMDGLKKKAEKSGIPYGILKQVYNRGMAAWKGGHRPGTTPQQWAYARVNSFITKGKGTWGGADSDLAAKVKGGKKETNESFSEFVEALEYGTDAARMAYARATPGQNIDVITAKYSANSALELMNDINLQRKFKLFSENTEIKEIDEAVEWHIDNKVSFSENVFRVGSESYYDLYKRVRELHTEGKIELSDDDRMLIEETDIGEIAEYEGQYVPLDCPMIDEGIAATIGAMIHGGEYKEALKTLKDVMARKKAENKVAHNLTYYAAQVAKSFKHVDARKLASMMEEYEDEIDDLNEGLSIWKYNPASGLWKIERDVTDETKDKWLEIYKKDDPKGKYIVSAKKPSSKAHLKEEDEKDPPLNQPKRGGPKKFYVYVRDPSSGNIKKVTWGDTTGLSVKMNDPEARKSFAARHQCSTQKDRTSAAYWACNTPRYAKQLGLSGGGNFFW
jgi:hypothetical protein